MNNAGGRGSAWTATPIPSASAPVLTRWLGPLFETDSRCLAVRFPPEWERVEPGHYEVDEEFLVLRGSVTIDEIAYAGGDYGFIPAQRGRSETRSPTGMLAVALFHGAPRWVAGRDGESVVPSKRTAVGAIPLEPGPLGLIGRCLGVRTNQALWLTESANRPDRATAETLLVSLAGLHSAHLQRGDVPPALPAPLLIAVRLDGEMSDL